MAYKVSYKVVSQQGEQLKTIAKEMDNYVNQINQIVSKLGSDELLQSVRSDLNKFKKQLEEEKTILNLAGQVITDVVQGYTGVEKKSVSKVDKAKAHNRDFYKRPVSVASAGGGAATAAAAGAGAAASATSVNVSSTSASFESHTTNVFTAPTMSSSGSTSTPNIDLSAAARSVKDSVSSSAAGGMADMGGIAVAAGTIAAAAAGIGGAAILDNKDKKKAEAEAGEAPKTLEEALNEE